MNPSKPTTPAAAAFSRRATTLAVAVLLAAGAAAYSNGFTGRFTGLDARESIVDNPHIKRLWPLTDAMSLRLLAATKAVDEGSKGGTVVRRPMLSLSFALNHALTGMNADGFHAVNLAIHLCAGLLLFGILRRTLARTPYGERLGATADGLALVTAVAWLVHPVQVESVTYIVQRAESLMGMLFLATLYASIRAFDSPAPCRWYAAAVCAAALAMGTKEVAAVAPVLVLLYDATFVSQGLLAALRKRRVFYACLFSTWLVIAGLMLATLDDVSSDFTEGRNLAYALAQPAVILHYLRIALWPRPLHVYVNTTLYDGLNVPWMVVPALVLAAPLAVTAMGLWRLRWYGFLGASFFLVLAPSSSIVAVSDVVQEHRMYLPLAPVLLALVLAVWWILGRLAGTHARNAAIALAAPAVVALCIATHARNEDFHSEFAMIHPADLHEAFLILGNHYALGDGDGQAARREAEAALAAGAPASADVTFAHYLLGLLDDRSGALEQAAAHFAAAAENDPTFVRAVAKLGETLLALDRPAQSRDAFARAAERLPASADIQVGLGRALLTLGDTRAALAHFERAAALEPYFPVARNNLGFALESLGEAERAMAEYRAALVLDPGMVVASNNLARMLAQRGDAAGARATYERVLATDPGEVAARIGLADVCLEQGDRACAELQLAEAARLDPADAQAVSKLGVLLEEQGRIEEARAAYERALAIAPTHTGARNALATLLARQGKLDEAAGYFEQVLRADPQNADAHANLGAVYATQGKSGDAVSHLEAVLRLDPRHPAVNFNLGLLAENSGDPDAAVRRYEAELAIDPAHSGARERLARLKAQLAGTP